MKHNRSFRSTKASTISLEVLNALKVLPSDEIAPSIDFEARRNKSMSNVTLSKQRNGVRVG